VENGTFKRLKLNLLLKPEIQAPIDVGQMAESDISGNRINLRAYNLRHQ
jgi:hypothetical protein